MSLLIILEAHWSNYDWKTQKTSLYRAFDLASPLQTTTFLVLPIVCCAYFLRTEHNQALGFLEFINMRILPRA